MRNFLLFVKLLTLELLCHKWLKATLLSVLTIWLVNNKELLISIANSHQFPTVAVLFLAYYIRFLIPELIPKKSIADKHYQRLNFDDIRTENKCAVISTLDNEEVGKNITWNFTDSMFAQPTIIIERYKSRFSYDDTLLDLKINTFENRHVGKSSARFEVLLKHGKRLSSDAKLEDFLENIEILAVATHFDSRSYYQRILNFVSIDLKKVRLFKCFF